MAEPTWQKYRVRVTETRSVETVVVASSLEEAKAVAEKSEFPRKGEINSNVIAAWPVVEAEEPPSEFLVYKGVQIEVRRGWFWEAGKDFSSACLLAADLFVDGLTPDSDPYRIAKAAERLTDEGNETVFAVLRGYGWAARLVGETLWSPLDRTARNKPLGWARDRLRKRLEKAAAAQAAAIRADHIAEALTQARRGGIGALTRCKGGRWIALAALEGRIAAEIEPRPDEWSTNTTVIRDLISDGLALVFDKYAHSGDPRQVSLTADGWRESVDKVVETA